MKAFLVGLLVIMLMACLTAMGFLLIPLLMFFGFFLRWFLGLALIILTIWLVGKVTLISIDYLRSKE